MKIPDEMNCWANFPAMVGGAACYEALAEECMGRVGYAIRFGRENEGGRKNAHHP